MNRNLAALLLAGVIPGAASAQVAGPPIQVTAVDLGQVGMQETSITLAWICQDVVDPGLPWEITQATSYELRYATTDLPFEDMIPVDGDLPSPAEGGTRQTFILQNLDMASTYWFIMRTFYQPMRGVMARPADSAPYQGSTSADVTAPGAIADLSAESGLEEAVTLRWTATGDNDSTGQAARISIRYSTAGAVATEEGFLAATPIPMDRLPRSAGEAELFTAFDLPAGLYYFSIRAYDEAGNPGPLPDLSPSARVAMKSLGSGQESPCSSSAAAGPATILLAAIILASIHSRRNT